MTNRNSDKEESALLQYFEVHAQPNTSNREFLAMAIASGISVAEYRVKAVAALFRKNNPKLFTRRKRNKQSAGLLLTTEIGNVGLRILPLIKNIDSTIEQVRQHLLTLGFEATFWKAHQVRKVLKKKKPELFSPDESAAELREITLFLKPHIQINNPSVEDIGSVAIQLGQKLSFSLCRDIRADLFSLSPELFSGPLKSIKIRKAKRRTVRWNMTEADLKVLDEFIGMVNVTQIDSLGILTRSLLYLTVTRQINLPAVIDVAKNMSEAQLSAYSKIYRQLDLSGK